MGLRSEARCRDFALLLGLLLLLLPVPGSPATMPPIRMKVVDVQDGNPIAAAHVLFLGTAQEGTDGAWRQNRKPLRRRSNDERHRQLRLPKQEFPAQPFFLSTVYVNPRLVVLKPGYTLLTRISSPNMEATSCASGAEPIIYERSAAERLTVSVD
jgi:hypothetical protein